MIKLFLIAFILITSSVLAQEQGDGVDAVDYFFDADSNEPAGNRDGSENHPYKYLSELPESVSGTVKLYFILRVQHISMIRY